MLRFQKLHDFVLAPGTLRWPWVAFTPARTAFVAPTGPRWLTVRSAADPGAPQHLELSDGLALPTAPESGAATTARQPGLHAMALHPDERTVVGLGWHGDGPVGCVSRLGAAPELVDLTPALGALGPMAATFARDGQSLWVSAERAGGAALLRLSFPDLRLEARATFSAPPPPAAHELLLHPTEDAVLLTMACGQDGTFVQVGRMVRGQLGLVVTDAEEGLEPCGAVEVSDDGARVCLVAAGRVELRRWPDLLPLAQLEVPDGLVANYAGARFGGRLVISAAEEEEGQRERGLVLSEALALEDDAPVPPGMWAGRLGQDKLVAIGRPMGAARAGFIYRVESSGRPPGLMV